jgi:hypothetical protein
MPRAFGCILPTLLILVPSGGAAQSCDPPTATEAIARVDALNQQYIEAARTGDAAWFDAHMASDVLVILGSGRRQNKTEFLQRLRAAPRGYRSLTVRDATVRAFGTVAQVDADAPWTLTDGATGVSRYIDTYAWIDCRWRVISAQITLLPPPGGEP